jgi:hypothetical protein
MGAVVCVRRGRNRPEHGAPGELPLSEVDHRVTLLLFAAVLPVAFVIATLA